MQHQLHSRVTASSTFLASLLAAVASGCGGTAEVANQQRDGKALANEAAPAAAPDAADALFATDHVPTFTLSLPPSQWAALIVNARSEQYTEAALEFDGTAIGTVGLRFKGNYGTLGTCFDAADNLICSKLSIKLHFSEYDQNLRFLGLKHLNFNSNRWDDSNIRETLAFSLYREMGIVAPRAAWANIVVNGEPYGLYGMVEEVDGRFTDNRWPGNGNGNLYKEAWPTSEEVGEYEHNLKTNEGLTDHRAILALAAALNERAGSSKTETASTLSQWMSLEYLRRYIVVDEAIMNSDGFTTIYTNPEAGWTHNHNYYFYQEETRDRFWLVPWDLHGTFWIQDGKSNVPSWTETPSDCSIVYSVFNGDASARAPGCDPIFRAIAADMTQVNALVDELLKGPFATETMLAKIDAYAAFIRDAVAADPKLDEKTKVTNFESSVADMKRAVPLLADRLRAIAKRTPVKPIVIPMAGAADFETSTTLDAKVSVVASVNAASTAAVSIGEDSGNHVLHCGFEMRDETKPWGQWATFAVPTAEAPGDVSSLRGIHLRYRASRPGTARIEFAGQVNWDRKIYDLLGWNVNLTTEWVDRDFWFSDAVPPRWFVADPNNPAPTLAEVLSTIVQVRALVDCVGRNTSGQLGTTLDGTPRMDTGYVELDDLQFIP